MEQIQTKLSKTKIAIIIILILSVLGIILFYSRALAPVKISPLDSSVVGEENTLKTEIDKATTFDNEADLKEIDTEFQ